jgi:DIS3-like exonuclease 1
MVETFKCGILSCSIIVRLDNWELGSQYPNGHFVWSLGPAGQLETEIAAILIEHNIQVPPFSDGLVSKLKLEL